MTDLDARRAYLKTLLAETEAKLAAFRVSTDPAELAEVATLERGVTALHVQIRAMPAA